MSGEYYHTWKGVAGTQTWDIGRTDFALNIMFSITYDQNLHSNWLAVGIQPKDSVTNFYTMYNEDENELRHTLRGCLHNYNTLKSDPNSNFTKDDFLVVLVVDGYEKIPASFKEMAREKGFLDEEVLF